MNIRATRINPAFYHPRSKQARQNCRNFRDVHSDILFHTSRLSFLPSSPDFGKLSSQMARHLEKQDKKIFSTRYQRRGTLDEGDVGWQRSHGTLNVFFTACLSRAKISRSSRRDLLVSKKKKKNSSSSPLALFFPARPFFSPTPSPSPLHSFVHEDFDGDSSPTSAPVIAIIHTTEEDPRYDTKRGTNRPESGAKSDKSRRWTNLRRIWEQEGEKKIGKSVPRDTNNNK